MHQAPERLSTLLAVTSFRFVIFKAEFSLSIGDKTMTLYDPLVLECESKSLIEC